MISVLSFMDEMEKISGLGDMAYYSSEGRKKARAQKKYITEAQAREGKKKQAGFMQNIGTRIATGIPRAGANVGNTMKTMFTHPVQGVKAGFKATTSDLKGKPLLTSMLAASTAMGVNDLRKKEDPTGQGRSRASRAVGFVGDQAGGLIGAPFGISGSIAGSVVGKKIGDTVGKGIDKVRGYKKKAPAMVQASAPAQSAQRIQG